MARSLILFAVCLILVVAESHGWFFSRPSERKCKSRPTREDWKNCSKCDLFSPRDVTLRAINVLREPSFDVSVTLNCTRLSTLFDVMQDGADANTDFRFTASYGAYGFFIDSINGAFGDYALDQSYWQILDGEMKPTPVGASTYKPKAGETVTFNLTRGGH